MKPTLLILDPQNDFFGEFCVLSTARGTLERGYRSAILTDGIAGMNGRYTQFVLELSPCITLAELDTELVRKFILFMEVQNER